MKSSVPEITCDRCEEFITFAGTANPNVHKLICSEIDGEILCPKCSELYNKKKVYQ